MLIFLSESLIRSFLGKKTSDSPGKPMSKFPALGPTPQTPPYNFQSKFVCFSIGFILPLFYYLKGVCPDGLE